MGLKIEEQLLRRMWPHGDSKIPGLIAGIAASSERVFAQYGITTPLQVAHIMAQISHECGAGLEVVENLSYSARRMTQVWPSRFPTVASALPYANNPRKLGDKVYGGRMGNRAGTDDGYNNRGRGAAQTTGAEGYAKLAAKTGIDLVNNPDLINDPANFLLCGVADFIICGCLPFCSPRPGLPTGDIRAVTHHLNGGYEGLAQRQAWFAKWWPALRGLSKAAPVPAAGAPVALLAPGADATLVPDDQTDDAAQDVADADDGVLRYGRGHDAPDFEVKALQAQLVSLGYQVGEQDGDFGGGTRAAVLAFQADNGLETTGEVDQPTKAALKTAPPKPISEKRANATADDLRAGGSGTIAKADQLSWWSKLTLAAGIGGGGAQKVGLLDTVKDATDHVSMLRSVSDSVRDVGGWALSNWWIFVIAGGVVGAKIAGDIVKQRLADHRSASNMNQ
jgi:putative chitinase